MPSPPFIALTDKEWFDFLLSFAESGRLDEVNFWSPKSLRPMKHMSPGEPVFFRLKRPHYAIAGYGFFAHFAVMSLEEAWETFALKNGDPDKLRFLKRIGEYRDVDLRDPGVIAKPIGCTILRDAKFWDRSRWIPWGPEAGWHGNIVQGKTEEDSVRASRLLAEIEYDHLGVPEEFVPEFRPMEVDERQLVIAQSYKREGQGAFRSRVMEAYGRRCAITGERTEPVLDAAHVQPYLGPRSNHVQNGLLLTKEFHTLFDLGFVTVTPELKVRVSPRLREQWKNGKRFYAFDQQDLRLPEDRALQPSRASLGWHQARVFRA
jgi:putative restriction endonuclease